MPDQVANLIERSADDMTDNSGCKRCATAVTTRAGGACSMSPGALQRATGEWPTADAWEPNDDTGTRAYTVTGPKRQLKATLDAWDDPNDVYRVFLRPGVTLSLQLDGRAVGASVSVWRPGTRTIDGAFGPAARPLARVTGAAGTTRRVSVHATSQGLALRPGRRCAGPVRHLRPDADEAAA